MKSRFLYGVLLLSLSVISGFAAPTVAELEDQVAAKKRQLDELSAEIAKLDAEMEPLRQRVKFFAELFKSKKETELLLEKPEKGKDLANNLFDREIGRMFEEEIAVFVKALVDVKNKKGSVFVDDAFFGYLHEGFMFSSIFKYSFMKIAYDQQKLSGLIVAWEKIHDEYIVLLEQIEAAAALDFLTGG